MQREILKVGLAAIHEGKLLVVRKRGGASFILPGGKPEQGEAEIDTLRREVDEELGCTITTPYFLAAFSDAAADLAQSRVTVKLYVADLCGRPMPAAEIEELCWIDMICPPELQLAPSIANHILPYLRQQKRLSRIKQAAAG